MTNVKTQSGIYCWSNKINGKKYVGQAQDLRNRRNKFLNFNQYDYAGEYINRARQKYNDADYWQYITLEYCTIDELSNKETYWIQKYKEYGFSLYNLTNGGEGMRGYKPTEETKRKISEANKGRIRTEEERKKLSIANTGKHLSEETRKKLSEALKGENHPFYGKHLSNETKEKLRLSHLGIRPNEETKRKLSEVHQGERNPNFGKPRSEETKRKIAEANRGKHRSEETKEKLRKIGLGRKASEETKRKMSASQKGRKMSAEARKKISESHKGEKNPMYLKNRVAVLQIAPNTNEIIKEWDSISEARNTLKINGISYCIHGKQKTAGGFIWRKKTA